MEPVTYQLEEVKVCATLQVPTLVLQVAMKNQPQEPADAIHSPVDLTAVKVVL